jgi:hypothetical protein
MVAGDPWTAASIVRGEPVIAGNLDPEVFRRALRGASLPPASEFVVIDHQMLDAIAEAGPLTLKRKERRR